MSLAPLLGLPGKAKTMLDRLTATRATNLDSIDATVSSRAAASTALSSATYTAARAATIDKIDGGGTATNYTSTRAANLDNLRASHIRSAGSGTTTLTADTWTTVGTITNADKTLLSLCYSLGLHLASDSVMMRISGVSVQVYSYAGTGSIPMAYSYVEFY